MASTVASDLVERGLELYARKVAAIFEPRKNNRYVAIHVPTEDFAVGLSSGDAMRGILKLHPQDGQVVIRRIGPDPDCGMAARVLAGEMEASTKS